MAKHLFRSGDPKRGGRKKGTPNKRTIMGREFAEKLVRDPEYLANLEARAKQGRLHPSVESLMWYYAMGKPKDQLELSGSVGTRDVREMSEAELLEALEAHTRHAAELLAQHAAAAAAPPQGD